MNRWTQADAQCLVYTYKEGLLSAVAHDLEIRCGEFTITTDERHSVRAEFEASSLRVLHAVKDGRANPGALSARDREKIEENIRREVLEVARFPKILFEGRARESEASGTFEVEGELTIRGKAKSLRTCVRLEDEHWVSRVTLHQPDFGIVPFRAMMGTLRIKPELDVVIRAPRKDSST